MISVELKNPKKREGLLLGEVLRFEIRFNAGISWRAFIKFQSVQYVKPLTAWSREPNFVFFPEAPGDYELQIAWREASGAQGFEKMPFAVGTGSPLRQWPHEDAVSHGFRVWSPSQWDGGSVSRHEKAALQAAKDAVRSGQVAYDIGANLGVYTLHFLRCVGPSGHVYSFEFNPVCVQFLLSNVSIAGHRNCSILPVALGADNAYLAASVNYGVTAVGLTAASEIYAQKAGHELTVQCARLDTLVQNFSLRKPDFIKIDVEGAESAVLWGMQNILEKHRPILLIELHGHGAAAPALKQLDRFNYTIENLETKRIAKNSAEFLEGMGDQPVQVICRPC